MKIFFKKICLTRFFIILPLFFLFLAYTEHQKLSFIKKQYDHCNNVVNKHEKIKWENKNLKREIYKSKNQLGVKLSVFPTHRDYIKFYDTLEKFRVDSRMPSWDYFGLKKCCNEENPGKRFLLSSKKILWKTSKIVQNSSRMRIGNRNLDLLKTRIFIKIDGLRARTIVDQIFFHFDSTSEGTFQCTLPDRGNLSYFAFYDNFSGNYNSYYKLPNAPKFLKMNMEYLYNLPVEQIMANERNPFGKPKRAYAVPKALATFAYTTTVRKNIDPLLATWEGNNVFSIKIFPILQRHYQRIVYSYDQTLSEVDGSYIYQFYFPQRIEADLEVTLTASKNILQNSSCNLQLKKEYKKQYGFQQMKQTRGEVKKKLFLFSFPAHKNQAITTKDTKTRQTYIYGKITPPIPKKLLTKKSKKTIFLLDTSLSQQTDQFEIMTKLLKKILQNNSSIREFNILLFDIEAHWINKTGWIKNSQETRKQIFSRLSQINIGGTTDIRKTFSTFIKTPWVKNTNERINVHVLSDGQATFGETDPKKNIAYLQKHLQNNLQFFCYDMGLGNSHTYFFQLLTSQFGGNIFSCYGEKEFKNLVIQQNYESFKIKQITYHGLKDLLWENDVFNIFPGQSLYFASKHLSATKPQITFHGIFQNKPYNITVPLKKIEKSTLAKHAFGALAIQKMEDLELEDNFLKKTIIEYSRYFNIPRKTCSYLMLEEPDYKRFKINRVKNSQFVKETSISKLITYQKHISQKIPTAKEELVQSLKKNKIYLNTHIKYLLKHLPEKKFENIFGDSYKLCKRFLKEKHNTTNHWTFYIHQALKLYKQNQKNLAIHTLSTIIELEPQNAQVIFVLINLLLKEKKYSMAYSCLTKLRSHYPNNKFIYGLFAYFYETLQRYKMAALYYEILLSDNLEYSNILDWETVRCLEKADLDFFPYGFFQSSYRYKRRKILLLKGKRVRRRGRRRRTSINSWYWKEIPQKFDVYEYFYLKMLQQITKQEAFSFFKQRKEQLTKQPLYALYPPSFLYRVNYEFSVTGTFQQICKLIHLIENYHHLYLIDKIHMKRSKTTNKQGENLITALASLYTFGFSGLSSDYHIMRDYQPSKELKNEIKKLEKNWKMKLHIWKWKKSKIDIFDNNRFVERKGRK